MAYFLSVLNKEQKAGYWISTETESLVDSVGKVVQCQAELQVQGLCQRQEVMFMVHLKCLCQVPSKGVSFAAYI